MGIMSKCIRNNLNKFNVTNNTTDCTLVQSSFVSMGNIETPITVDNKASKHITKTTNSNLDDSALPLTPTQMMPNLSKINLDESEQDNIDLLALTQRMTNRIRLKLK